MDSGLKMEDGGRRKSEEEEGHPIDWMVVWVQIRLAMIKMMMSEL